KSINQLISHHAIIFEPEALRFWVSTQPWQLGEFICYDLNTVFNMKGLSSNHEIADTSLNIAADPFLQTAAFSDFISYRALAKQMMTDTTINPAQLVSLNPGYYDAY